MDILMCKKHKVLLVEDFNGFPLGFLCCPICCCTPSESDMISFTEIKQKIVVVKGSEIEYTYFCSEDVLQNIWDNPSNYYNVKDGSEEAYYEFLKFLWVSYPYILDKKDVMLVDLVKI